MPAIFTKEKRLKIGVASTVLSFPYYFLANFPVEIPAAVILVCDSIFTPWTGYKNKSKEGI